MTDHQQAAIEAVKGELDSQEAMHCTRVWEELRYGTMTKEDFVNTSEDDQCVQWLIAAAEPHLRRKWAEEVLNEGILGAGYSALMNPNSGEHPVTTFTRAVKHMFDILEGATE